MSTPVLVRHPDARTLLDAIAERGRADLSLTGGSMGGAVVEALAHHPQREIVDWTRVHVWWGDERYLPAGDPDRNDTQADAAGLTTLGLLPEHVHRAAGPDVSASAEASAAAYEQTLRSDGGGEWDVVLLGVGPDGHVASLFPGHPAQQSSDTLAVAVHDSPKPPPTRVSLTAGCLSRSREVWFVVAGEDKAGAVAKGVPGAPAEEVSTGLVRGLGRTLWLVDAAAARDLSG